MKNVFISLTLILFSFQLNAQSIVGDWGINSLLINADTQEYILYTTDPDRFHFGNNLKINADGTFVSFYTAPCGNDCFTTSTGKYEQINDTHIQFLLEKITHHGDCIGDSEPNLNLGLYAIHFDQDKIRFVKTSTPIFKDKEHEKN